MGLSWVRGEIGLIFVGWGKMPLGCGVAGMCNKTFSLVYAGTSYRDRKYADMESEDPHLCERTF